MRFYDTCSLLDVNMAAFAEEFYISDITLKELERIKVDRFKDADIKYKARQIGKMILANPDKVHIVFYREEYETALKEKYFLIPNDDSRIIISAIYVHKNITPIIFTTSDVNCYIIAQQIFNLKCDFVDRPWIEEYKGYKEIKFNNNEEMAHWYESIKETKKDILINQYIILKDKDGNIIDQYKKDANGKLQPIQYYKFSSKHFGDIKPKDVYQQCAMDSLVNNQFTILRGSAGTGKSLISLAYLFDQLDHGEIEKIIVFCNPVAVKNAVKLGFYPGDRLEKLLDSQIGNFLKSKIGAEDGVYQLIDRGMLELLPVADIRGYDTTGMNAGIYVTEAQNLSIDIAKLLIQRVGEDSKLIFDGDNCQQVDMAEYAGSSNGMSKAIEVFKGESCFGTVELPNIYRSRIAKIADKM